MKSSSTKKFLLILGCLGIGFAFFFSTKFWAGDDSVIRNTWETSYFSDLSYRVNIADVKYDESQHELFFVVNQTKSDNKTILKLTVDVIGKDGYLYPVQDFSHLKNETLPVDPYNPLTQTIYSFSMPTEKWRYIRFTIQTESENGTLSDQTILYADYRYVETSEEPLTLDYFLTLDSEDSEENQQEIESVVEEDLSVSESEILEQSYTIEAKPIILDGTDNHQHNEIQDTNEQVYTIGDLEHQEQKINEQIALIEEKRKENDSEDLQKQLVDLQQKLTDIQVQIKQLKGE